MKPNIQPLAKKRGKGHGPSRHPPPPLVGAFAQRHNDNCIVIAKHAVVVVEVFRTRFFPSAESTGGVCKMPADPGE